MNLSILIVSWNTRALLAQCLDSLAAHPASTPFEILVVDNASTDGTAAMIRERYPDVRLLANRSNAGFAAANNQAIAESRGHHLLLLNPDTEVRAHALDTLLAFMASHPRAGAVGARLLNPDGSLQHSCSRFPTPGRELLRLFHLDHAQRDEMAAWALDEARAVEVLLGACLLLRREALEEVGLLDEQYFMYTEEVDLCYRLAQADWAVHWLPQATVVHYGGQSTQQVAGQMLLHLYESKMLFFRKQYGRSGAAAYKLILLLASLARLALSPLALLEQPSQRRAHLSLAARYWRLLQALPGW